MVVSAGSGFPTSSVSQDGRALLHCEREGSSGQSSPQEDGHCSVSGGSAQVSSFRLEAYMPTSVMLPPVRTRAHSTTLWRLSKPTTTSGLTRSGRNGVVGSWV